MFVVLERFFHHIVPIIQLYRILRVILERRKIEIKKNFCTMKILWILDLQRNVKFYVPNMKTSSVVRTINMNKQPIKYLALLMNCWTLESQSLFLPLRIRYVLISGFDEPLSPMRFFLFVKNIIFSGVEQNCLKIISFKWNYKTMVIVYRINNKKLKKPFSIVLL